MLKFFVGIPLLAVTMESPVDELPKSLQRMIADCQNAVANWDPEEDADDPGMNAGNEWALRLSRGEFERELYWDCVGDDCEEAGDWQGAISVYRKILDLPGQHGMDHAKAYGNIAAIQSLLGDESAALASDQRATASLRDDSRILWRCFIAREISRLIRTGYIRRARKLIRRGLAAANGESVDHLGTARLLIASAKCDLASQKPTKAAKSLQLAWEWLDALVAGYSNDMLQQATGIQTAYMTWWSTEAKRRRIANEGDSEIEAFHRAIEKARLCFTPCGWQAPWHDLTLMNLLLRVADAYERNDQPTKAVAFREEANDIFTRRKFPATAKWRENPRRTPFVLSRRWWRSFHR